SRGGAAPRAAVRRHPYVLQRVLGQPLRLGTPAHRVAHRPRGARLALPHRLGVAGGAASLPVSPATTATTGTTTRHGDRVAVVTRVLAAHEAPVPRDPLAPRGARGQRARGAVQPDVSPV